MDCGVSNSLEQLTSVYSPKLKLVNIIDFEKAANIYSTIRKTKAIVFMLV